MKIIIHLTNILIIFVILHSGGILSAGHRMVNPSQGIPLFLKIITYDVNFNPDSIEAVEIYVVYDERRVESFKQLSLAEEYFKSKSEIKVAGKKVNFVPVAIKKLNSTLNKLSDSNYSILIVTELDKNQLIQIKEKTARYNIKTFSFNPEHVKLGFSVSIKLRNNKTKIVINLKSSREEGSEYSAHLLKMCEVLKK